jgi:regulator of RNase E activity RraA
VSNLGFRIISDFERVRPAIIDGFDGIATSTIADVAGRFCIMDHSIKSVNKPGIHLAGCALTVRTHSSDNLMVHKAIDLAKPGDIIVIDACGDVGTAILGEQMCHYAKTRGIAGYIVDGLIRDIHPIATLGFPVFTRGSSPRGTCYKDGPGEINTTICCGNVSVHPGDVIVADDDGVAVIPRTKAREILIKAQAHQERETMIIQSIYDGNYDRTWVDEALKKKGCEVVE